MSSAYHIVCHLYYYLPPRNDADKTGTSAVSVNSFDLPKEFFQMLAACGPYLHRDTQLLQKVCRVLKAYYHSSKESTRAANVVLPESRIEEALGSCLFPSLQLIPANPAVDMEIWGVLSLLPYEQFSTLTILSLQTRYRLYGEWEKETEQNPIVLAARQTAKMLKHRSSSPAILRLWPLQHGIPGQPDLFTVARQNLQVEAYRDMITPVVDAFKYLTQLDYDILQYIVLERLVQGGRAKLKDDGLNLSDWLQCLASFWGHLCKKHNAVELKSLLQYLVNQLKKGMGIELVELIQQMANVQYTENMTEEQVDAMAGSETLRQQASLFGATRNYKVLSKSTNRLRDSLLPKEEPKLVLPMLLLLAQHRSKPCKWRCRNMNVVITNDLPPKEISTGVGIIINADATYIKMVSEQFDRCHGILLQYVEFLSSAVTPTAYAQLIPPLQDLVHKYHIEPEVAFLIYRPVMRLFKSNNGGDTCWPLDDNEEGESVSSDDLILHLDSSQEPIIKSLEQSFTRFICYFLGLTLYDLHFPKDRYDTEIKKLHESLKQLEDNSDNSSIAISRCKKDKERIQDLLDKLNSKSQKHQQHIASVVQSDESVYERECANKPGFAVYFRYPNSQRVSYSQFVRVHWRWNLKITKALNQCMESKEYMEIRNALIVLTKISSVFPVIRKSGVNLEKRVAKLKGDDREDLKVLATGVAAALAARKSSWLSEEEFGMGHIDLKPATARSVLVDEPPKPVSDEGVKVSAKPTSESETRATQKRAGNAGKVMKHDVAKEDAKAGKSTSSNVNQQVSTVDREALSHSADAAQETSTTISNGNLHPVSWKVSSSSQRNAVTHNGAANPSGESTDLIDSTVRQQKRPPIEEQDRSCKRRKGANEPDLSEHVDKEKSLDSRGGDKFRSVDYEKIANEEQNLSRAGKMKEKSDDKYDRDPRKKLDRGERRRGEDAIERSTDRLSERTERSIERMQERVTDKAIEKGLKELPDL
ncbi:unnamed protein product [Miscanthus lutarioriparius]|uniref:THO complex subunit 2 n=1 Tax=Miscanthus lutarioriparius TaxID=422564 RepID=A0A811MZ68_9POAL|nr:unnamed protein product [Miscanthus lutarioriparius]